MERCRPKMQPENHIYTPENVRECTHTLSNELPLWELECLWRLEFSKRYFRGKKSLN
jgi:hypothetical protein